MKKENMLNESTIRRFMKLATIDGLSDQFVAENLDETTDEVEEGRMRAKRDDDKMREGEHDDEVDEGRMRAKRDDDKMREGEHDDDDKMREGAHEDDEDVKEGKHKDDDEMRESEEELTFEEEDLEERGMSMDRDDDMGAGEDAAGAMVSVDQLMSALERALEDVLGQEVEVSQDGDEMDADMGMGADMDMGPEEPMDMADAGEEEEEEEEEEELEEVNDDVIEEVFARVIQRLTQETKSSKE